MKKIRHLGAALSNLISTKETNQTVLSQLSGISQPAINRLIQGTRPTVETLAALCHAWKDPSDGITLLIEHLRDEIERADYNHESISITPRDGSDKYDQLADTLITAARIDPDIRALLQDLATLITRSKLDRNLKVLDTAADPEGESYKVRKKGKR
ncbi:MAG: helix-turn-helix transcriptional regulator [Kiritimatiellales bacterium]|nr:helix-turn-helix transcriptional regulator [Kiritimatiellales bacterium]